MPVPQRLRYADVPVPKRSKETPGDYLTRAQNWQSWADQARPNLWSVSETEYQAWVAWKKESGL